MPVQPSTRNHLPAVALQQAIDALAAQGGGELVLPPGTIELDRALQLHSHVHIRGDQAGTCLRKSPGRTYPLTGYHNYGMCDVPLVSTAGLEPGMTVSVLDDLRRGFYSTFATITRVEDGWVGLDRGLNADLLADANPVLTTAHPLLCGHRVHDVSISNLRLDGNRAENLPVMDACRGAALYFYQSRDCTIRGVTGEHFSGEGLGYQMCRDMRVVDCHFNHNSGNGFHPGAGSTNTLFEGCTATSNGNCGFFFCVRANHITVRRCSFHQNAIGISIGTRDCHNLIEGCSIRDNAGAGILARDCPTPVEVHTIHIRDCDLGGNGAKGADAQIRLQADADQLLIEGCYIEGKRAVAVETAVSRICLRKNHFSEDNAVDAPPGSLVEALDLPPVGYAEAAPAALYHHLDTP